MCYNNRMVNLNDNLESVLARIGEAAAKSGRRAQDIQIVAASKTRPIELLSALNALGEIAAFGENRVQEFVSKYDPSLIWDFIGQLQTNKVKYLIGKVRLIQSVDRDNLAAEIDRLAKKADIVQEVLIEINSGAEETKGGLLAADAFAFARSLIKYPNIALRGVMAVAPKYASKDELIKLFLGVREVFEAVKSEFPKADILSMGMSNDFETAIECGANLVRPGKILFE